MLLLIAIITTTSTASSYDYDDYYVLLLIFPKCLRHQYYCQSFPNHGNSLLDVRVVSRQSEVARIFERAASETASLHSRQSRIGFELAGLMHLWWQNRWGLKTSCWKNLDTSEVLFHFISWLFLPPFPGWGHHIACKWGLQRHCLSSACSSQTCLGCFRCLFPEAGSIISMPLIPAGHSWSGGLFSRKLPDFLKASFYVSLSQRLKVQYLVSGQWRVSWCLLLGQVNVLGAQTGGKTSPY